MKLGINTLCHEYKKIINKDNLGGFLLFYVIYLFIFETEFCPCCPGWSAMARSRISAHYNLHLLGTNDSPASTSQVSGITGMHHHAWLIFVLLVETGFYHVGQAGLELPTSGDLPASASQSAGITGVSHCDWPTLNIFKKSICTQGSGLCW